MLPIYPPQRNDSALNLFSACVAGFVFGGLGIHSATAQIVLPATYKEWQGPNGGSWDDPANWDGGLPSSGPWTGDLSFNPDPDNALFGYEPVGGVIPALTDDSIRQTVDAGSSNRDLRSLWFKAGLWYTLKGTGELWLGQYEAGAQDNYLLVVNRGDAGEQSEHTIEGFSYFSVSAWLQKQTVKIENWSEGGLGIFTEKIRLYDQIVQIGGTGATHFAGTLHTWGGRINVGLDGGTGDQPQPHFVLSANNSGWWGEVRVNYRGFAILKADQALGDLGTEKWVYDGGSLALRSHVETPLIYNVINNNLRITGEGIVRNEGTQRIGALYSDGGENHFGMMISFAVETFFGARGDRKGGLFLTNLVSGDTQQGDAFVKVGPGLIVLVNNTNNWTKDTVLRAGVLRLNSSGALPTFSNLVFEGGRFGGILELGYGTSFNYNLGTGFFNQLRWTGDGGFSAFGANRSVTLVDNFGNPISLLTWGSTTNFIGDGFALLLSSRYANAVIDFTNAIDLNGGQREVRVARGEDTAHAVLSGVLSGTGGLVKTDDGLLRLTGTNTYTGATEIRGGALRGAAGNTASNIVLAGGVLGLDANFTRGLGGSGTQIRWGGSGGFAAYGQNRSVTFVDNDGNPVSLLTWGTGSFIGNDSELRFGHYTANRTVLWDNALALGNGTRTIHIESGQQTTGAVVNFRQAISGTATLNLLGNGRIDFTADNSGLSAGKINLYGAELWLHGTGKLGAVGGFDIRHGGALVLDNSSGSASSRLKQTVTDSGTGITTPGAAITLAAGTLQLDSAGTAISEKVGDLTLEDGANAIELSRGSASVELQIENLLHQIDDPEDSSNKIDSRATLNVTGNLNDSLINFKLSNSASGHEEGGIIPWATANGSDWVTTETNGSNHYLRLFDSYQTSFGAGNNVKVSGSGSFSGDQTINSLNLQGTLSMGGNLTLSSGGLLSTGGERTISGSGSIMTGGILPLYIHTSDNLTFSDTARINVGSSRDIVKTLGGSLVFNNSGTTTHQARDLYIHQGTVELRDGTLQVRRIIIGDGAGTDKVILPGGVWNPIRGHGGGLPSITLRGTPYDPRGTEYGGDQAILQLGGNGPYGAGTKQRLAELRIEGRGTIDWRGGEVGKANILWIDELSFSSTSDILFIRNWYEYEDLFLVKKIHNGKEFNNLLLNQILFEGYQDYFTTWKDYDNDYWQIYAFGASPAPEPSTYGAILGAVGLGLVVWKRRRKAAK